MARKSRDASDYVWMAMAMLAAHCREERVRTQRTMRLLQGDQVWREEQLAGAKDQLRQANRYMTALARLPLDAA